MYLHMTDLYVVVLHVLLLLLLVVVVVVCNGTFKKISSCHVYVLLYIFSGRMIVAFRCVPCSVIKKTLKY